MKKGLILIVLLFTYAGLASAATTQKITFNDVGYYYIYDPVTNIWTYEPANININGNIRMSGSNLYLTPLTGTITIGGTDYQVNMKLPKQSEPIYYDEWSYNTTYYWYKNEIWYALTTLNIEGEKFIGNIQWWRYQGCWYNNCWDYSNSYISFNGLSKGKYVTASMYGPFPIIS